MTTWLRRVWHLLNRSRRERELVDEMREHRASMDDPSRFGDTHRLIEYSRDAWGWNWIDDAAQDLRIGMRGLKRSPVFTITAILILSFGIGLNLTVFQMANVGLLRGPAVKNPETLARLHRHGRARRSNSEALPYVAALAISKEQTALAAVMMESTTPVVWGEAPAVVDASFVSPNWFAEVGHAPLVGRAFAPAIDGAAGAAPSAVASYRFWINSLGGDPSAVGRPIRINNRPVTLIGVMPETFPELDLDASALWLSINQRDYYFPNSTFLTDWSSNNVAMYGRFKDGVPPAVARDSLRTIVAELHRRQPDHFDDGDWLEPAMATENFTEPAERLALVGVMSTVGLLSTLVLIVAAANLGNLVMSRTTGRARELGMRAALGAGRSRIIRQLAIEALPLGIAGGAGGLVLAMWATQIIATLGQAPAYLDFSPDRTAIALTLVLAALALVVVAALPAWKIAKHDLTDAIKDGGQQVSMRLDRARVRSLMLAAQVGGSCVVLMVSAMMVRSLQNALTADPGFSYERTAVVQAGLSLAGLQGEAARSFWIPLKERIAALPEAEAVAFALSPPFGGRGRTTGYPDAPRLRVMENHVDAEYFSTLDIPIVAGRLFAGTDDPATAVIVSRTLAQTMYGSTEVIGKTFPRGEPRDTIIGVAADTLTKPGDRRSADLYRPLAAEDFDRVVLLVRTRSTATSLVSTLRQIALSDRGVYVAAHPVSDDFDRRMWSVRLSSGIAALIGMLTLLLACIGIFGVVSFGATLRTKEVGIHLALGASRSSILRVITRQIVGPVSVGSIAGTAAALPIGFALTSSPLQLSFADPISYLSALLILAAGAGTAALVPAWRALRNDPISALRHE